MFILVSFLFFFSEIVSEFLYGPLHQQNYYNLYGGGAAQYPIYGGGSGMVTGTAAFYPYFQFGQGGGSAATYTSGHGYGMQYPQMYHYSGVASTAGLTGLAQHYGGPLSIAPTPSAQAGDSNFILLDIFCDLEQIPMCLSYEEG